MSRYEPYLHWIDAQAQRMHRLVDQWARINSGTFNLGGLAAMAAALREAFEVLGGRMEMLDVSPAQTIDASGQLTATPLGKALSIRQRAESPRRVLLCIHMDTVYPPDSPFQTTRLIEPNRLQGPGVADAKGGLAVMLIALEAMERSPWAGELGWEVLINPDEEIGSPGSLALLRASAHRNHVGLLFEPALPDGGLIGRRKGSGNFTLVVRGRSAHAGRDPHLGRNAVAAMAQLVVELTALNGRRDGLTVNVGKVEGGGAVNIVPDLAICRFNVRMNDPDDQAMVTHELDEMVKRTNSRDGLGAELHGAFYSPPKLLDGPTSALLHHLADCGRDLGIELHWQDSGGVCDGNKLAAAGLANVDTLGPRGGEIHSHREYVLLDSLTERAKLSALFMMKLGAARSTGPRGDT